jgi:hypothetical protein
VFLDDAIFLLEGYGFSLYGAAPEAHSSCLVEINIVWSCLCAPKIAVALCVNFTIPTNWYVFISLLHRNTFALFIFYREQLCEVAYWFVRIRLCKSHLRCVASLIGSSPIDKLPVTTNIVCNPFLSASHHLLSPLPITVLILSGPHRFWNTVIR